MSKPDHVVTDNSKALAAALEENERFRKEQQCLRSGNARQSIYLQIATSLIDDHPYERMGMDWDYEHPLHDSIATLLSERDALAARVAELEAQRDEARDNDRTAMSYLAEVRELVGGDDFPDMVRRTKDLSGALAQQGKEEKGS